MIKGYYTIVKHKAKLIDGQWVAGEIVDTIGPEENSIQYYYFDKLVLNLSHMDLNGSSSFVSQYPMPNALNVSLRSASEWIAGSQEGNSFWTDPDYSDVTPANGYWTLRTRFVPPAQTRYIRSIATQQATSTLGARPFSCLNLTTPCIQENDEILDIFYRIFVDWQGAVANNSSLTKRQANGVYRTIISNSTTASSPGDPSSGLTYPSFMSVSPFDHNLPGRFWVKDGWQTSSTGYTDATPVRNRWSSRSSAVNALQGHSFTSTIRAIPEEYDGWLMKSISMGWTSSVANEWIYRTGANQPIDKGTTSCVQNVYDRQADTGNFRAPFLNINDLSTSAASIAITDSGTWAATTDDPFAHHYRIKITSGGLAGVAEYKIMRRRGTGWKYASYSPLGMAVPTMYPGPDFPNNTNLDQRFEIDDEDLFVRHGQSVLHQSQDIAYNGSNVVVPYKYPEFFTVGPAGVTIMHVKGTFENVDANSTIPLPVTDILQVAVAYNGAPIEETTDFFVACGATGLWKVERPASGPVTTVTQITPAGITNPNSCRGVTVNKSNGDVWAIFHDTTDSICYMAKSTDQGSTWTLYNEASDPQFLITNFTSGSPGPSNIIGLTIDPNKVQNEFFIFAPTAVNADNSTNQGFWWSEAGSSPTSNQTQFSSTYGASTFLGYKITGPLGAVPLDTNQWIMSGKSSASSYPSILTTFGSASHTATSSGSSSVAKMSLGYTGPLVVKDKNGNDVLIGNTGGISQSVPVVGRYPADFGSTLNYDFTLYDSTASMNTTGITYLNEYMNTSAFWQGLCAYIGNGIFVGKNASTISYWDYPFFFTTFYGDGRVSTEEALPWFEEYGWNGTSWELDNPNSRLTHSTDEDMIDTLQIRFDDNAGADPYVVGEYYDAYVYDGVLHDNATSLSQTIYTFLQSTESGTSFTPSTVPVADVGSVSNEPVALLWGGKLGAAEGLDYTHAFGEPGIIINGNDSGTSNVGSGTEICYLEHQFVGDFEFRFKLIDNINTELRIGLTDWSNITSQAQAIPVGTPTHFNVTINKTGLDNVTGNIDYSIRVNTIALNNSGTSTTISQVDRPEGDIFAFRRVGSTLTFLINGVVEYTFGSAVAQDLGVIFGYADFESNSTGGWTLYDGEIDYTINRRYVEVGDGVTTGANDINFARLIVERLEGVELQIFLDGTPVVILTDGITAPGVGEVNILPYSGRLWFNSADAGRAITGNWRILKKLNLE